MIITIKGADFSGSNIGTLDTYLVSKSIGAGTTYDIPNYVTKNAAVSWTITLSEGYTFGTYSVTMGGATVTPTISSDGKTMTIAIAAVTGKVVISVATVNESTGEEDSGGSNLSDYIVDPWACWGNGTESATSGYFSVVDYPITAGLTYLIPYGRNYFFEDSSHTYISGGAGGGSTSLKITAVDNAAYLTICFKSEEISSNDISITIV